MRLIDVGALIDDCKKYLNKLNPSRGGKEYTRINWLIGILSNATTIEPEQWWIPCEERLPETDNEVLITVLDVEDDYLEVYKGFYQDHEWWTQWCHGCLKIKDESCGVNIVTAWMPLPEPWKEGE